MLKGRIQAGARGRKNQKVSTERPRSDGRWALERLLLHAFL